MSTGESVNEHRERVSSTLISALPSLNEWLALNGENQLLPWVWAYLAPIISVPVTIFIITCFFCSLLVQLLEEPMMDGTSQVRTMLIVSAYGPCSSTKYEQDNKLRALGGEGGLANENTNENDVNSSVSKGKIKKNNKHPLNGPFLLLGW